MLVLRFSLCFIIIMHWQMDVKFCTGSCVLAVPMQLISVWQTLTARQGKLCILIYLAWALH